MLFAITATPEAGESIPGVSGPITTPSYQISANDLAVIFAAAGANPQSFGVLPKNAVTLATPAGVLNALAQKIVGDVIKLANSYQAQQAAQKAIAAVPLVSFKQAAS